MKDKLYRLLKSRKSSKLKSLAVLVDPDKLDQIDELLQLCKQDNPDIFLVGSSFRGDEMTSRCITRLREVDSVPVALFPGNMNQVSNNSDALLLLSVISSRNPDLLIGRHVEAALRVKQSGLEIIPTGYILVESGRLTSVQYMSQSLPVPRTKPELAAATAMAGEQLGLKAIYLEAGSGADETVPSEMISAVSKSTEAILFSGGGIVNENQLSMCYKAGADIAVIGNALERSPSLITSFIKIRDTFNP